jgi:hypothetical protein
MYISEGATVIINAARKNPHDADAIKELVEQYPINATVEAITILAQIRPPNPGGISAS